MKFDLATEQKRTVVSHYLQAIKSGRVVMPADAVLATALVNHTQGQIK